MTEWTFRKTPWSHTKFLLRCRNNLFIRVWRIRMRDPRFSTEFKEGGLLSWILPRGSRNHQICKATLKSKKINNRYSIFKRRKISYYWSQPIHRRISIWNYNTIRQRWMMNIFNKGARASNSRDRCPLIIILDSNNRKCWNLAHHPSQPELTFISSLP